MSRPTTIQHPLATLRKAVNLGRDQMSARLKMSRPALEKVERGRNPFTALLRERVFAATGVCPGWLATEEGPIHSCDGYPFDEDQLSRWEKWCDQPPIPSAPLGVVTGIGGRKLGPLYRRTCCPGPDRSLAHAAVEPVGGTQLTARQWQSWMKSNQRQRMAEDLIDRVRGATALALKDWEKGEAPFWELVAAVDRLFPGVQPVGHSADVEAGQKLLQEMSAGIQNASDEG
jgi:transcriptional regulator with XRE-family HTH domain